MNPEEAATLYFYWRGYTAGLIFAAFLIVVALYYVSSIRANEWAIASEKRRAEFRQREQDYRHAAFSSEPD